MSETCTNGEIHIFDPNGFGRLENLVQRYRAASSLPIKHELFQVIAAEIVPVVEWVSCKSGWLSTIGESDIHAITSEFVLKLPKVLDGYRPETGFKLFSYLVKSIENTFRKLLRKKRNIDKHTGDWPRDDSGRPRDLEDCSTTFVSNARAQERSDEFERLMFAIPNEIGEGLPHANLMRYIARRYLDQADNEEQLYISELASEVARLPCHSLDQKQIDNLVRATIGGVRARLFQSCLIQDTESPAWRRSCSRGTERITSTRGSATLAISINPRANPDGHATQMHRGNRTLSATSRPLVPPKWLRFYCSQ
jgi:hypothetical protein